MTAHVEATIQAVDEQNQRESELEAYNNDEQGGEIGQEAGLANRSSATAADEAQLFSRTDPDVPYPSASPLEPTTSSSTNVPITPRLLDKFANLAILGTFAFLGLLARLGLVAIGTHSDQSPFALLWAQIAGCALMGTFSVRKDEIERIYTPLYAGLTTGLCGSMTSFSSWMAGVFQAFAHIGLTTAAPRDGFYNFTNGLGQSIFTLSASVAALTLGTHLGPVLLPDSLMSRLVWQPHPKDQQWSLRGYMQNQDNFEGNTNVRDTISTSFNRVSERNDSDPASESETPKHPRLHPRHYYSLAARLALILFFLLLWLVSIVLSIFMPRWRGTVLFSLVFAPVGVWLRFYAAQLNPKNPKFPMGTFIVNEFGTAVLAGCLAVQFSSISTAARAVSATVDEMTRGSSEKVVICQVVQGLDDGFCGCLTTVSTLILEVRKLERKHAYLYMISSWFVGQAIMLVLLGSVDFAKGVQLESQKCALL